MTPVKTKFLLADDDADDADLFCEALHRIASVMKCYKVENGQQVFQFLSGDSTPDVIFLDINMPIMDGWECLKKLKDNPRFKSIPTIMYSTSSAKKDVDLAYRLGAALFVTKPEDFNALCKILEIVASNPHQSLSGQLNEFPNVKLN